MMKDAPVIFLDEATANVDPENENELMRAIQALTAEKTVIMIAHRLNIRPSSASVARPQAGRSERKENKNRKCCGDSKSFHSAFT